MILVIQVLKDLLVQMVRLVLKVLKEIQVILALKEVLVPKDQED